MNRIGLDMHVVDGKFQGSRTHVLELFSRVIPLCPDIEFFLFSSSYARLLESSSAFESTNVSWIEMPARKAAARVMWELPRLQREHELDLLHTQYIMPMPSFCPCVVTIHDLLFESHPQYFTRVFRARSKWLVRRAVRRALRIITGSKFSRASLEQIYGIRPERVSVIANGVDLQRFHPSQANSKGADLVVARGLAPGGFILTVGRLEPRKNHRNLFQAHRLMGADAPPLVCVGQRDFGYRELLNLLEEPELRGRVRILEDVSDDELPALYRHALFFVYPSFAEGFGMPPLEAMASGTPVIAAQTTSLAEVIGEAGLAIDPGRPKSIAAAMQSLVGNRDLGTRMAALGLKQAQQFSWDSAARALAVEYRALLGSS